MQIEKVGDKLIIKREEELNEREAKKRLTVLVFDKERLTKQLQNIELEMSELLKYVALEEIKPIPVIKNKTI